MTKIKDKDDEKIKVIVEVAKKFKDMDTESSQFVIGYMVGKATEREKKDKEREGMKA